MPDPTPTSWPELPYGAWRDTCATLQLWTQIVGKIRLTLTPWLNHSWHVTLYVTARGLTTSPIPYDRRAFEMLFDFNSRTVEDFYGAVMAALGELGISIRINEYPCEIAGAIRFSKDRTHSAYDARYAQRFWRVLVEVDRVMKQFRTGFLGKSSPVHFFWGSFDLAVTRFSGRAAPAFTGKAPGLDAAVMREAYSHEVSSAGFWPGGNGIDYPAFYSYAYPTPPRFKECEVLPEGAFFSATLGEFLLPYDKVITAPDPDAALLSFLQSTYEAAAESAGWDRAALECPRGTSGVPRKI
jgi:hypothetical protein